jgi:PIN domain nuclease of toxin-antitoxin system
MRAIDGARAGDALYLSVISCWEVAKLVEKGKLRFNMPVRQWIEGALMLPGVQLEGLSPDICVESTELPGSFHGDPADQIIVATARVLGAEVVTSDRQIRDYEHVASVW